MRSCSQSVVRSYSPDKSLKVSSDTSPLESDLFGEQRQGGVVDPYTQGTGLIVEILKRTPKHTRQLFLGKHFYTFKIRWLYLSLPPYLFLLGGKGGGGRGVDSVHHFLNNRGISPGCQRQCVSMSRWFLQSRPIAYFLSFINVIKSLWFSSGHVSLNT